MLKRRNPLVPVDDDSPVCRQEMEREFLIAVAVTPFDNQFGDSSDDDKGLKPCLNLSTGGICNGMCVFLWDIV